MDDFVKHTKDRDDNRSETQRLTDQHDTIVAAMAGKLILPPIDLSSSPLRILDSGCADGHWIFDLRATTAVEHEYIGTDIDQALYPIDVPANAHFQNQSIHDDFPNDWKGTFDIVHQRLVMAAAPPHSIQSIVDKLVGLLKPGGWLQLVEIDTDSAPSNGPALKSFLDNAQAMSSASGIGPNLAKELRGCLKNAGLEGVVERSVTVKHGAASTDKSLITKSVNSLCNAVPPLMQGMKMILPDSYSKSEASTLQSRLRKELEEVGGHTQCVIVWGQKV